MEFLSQNKNFFIAIGIILIFVILAQNVRGYYATQLQNLENKRSQILENEQLVEKWQTLKNEYERVSQNFFAKEVTSFKRFVEEKAQIAGVRINSLNVQQSSENNFLYVRLDIKVSSTYKNFLSFIKLLEDKYTILERLDFRKSKGKELDISMALRSIVIEN